MGKLDEKVAIVTGATLLDAGVGIGGATAQLMAREGAKVLVADKVIEPAERLAASIRASGGEAVACEVDLRDEAQIAKMVEAAVRAFGGLDILHNNAAVFPFTDGDVVSMDAALWDMIMEVNARGTMLACKHAIPQLIRRGGGAIVNTSSGSALMGDLIRVAYGASKAAVNILTQYVATQYGRQGIRCNAVCPGGTRTPPFKENMTPEIQQMLLAQSLTPRLTEPEDLARVVVFLASDDAAQITGQILSVDGGLLAHTPFYAEFLRLQR